MAANGNTNGSGGYWSYLIRSDKGATPQLQDLCLGLAKVIRDLEPAPDSELTPQRLAAFYKQTGGNYDTVFLQTDHHGISFMYRTLGCRHSLQPTHNDFETPSIPCLTDSGFARWQTLQLLLCPEDSVRSLQKAVQIYDVPRPDGGYFPRDIPTECFPTQPDQAMEHWYKHVVGSMNQDNYIKRLKNSPYQSPYPDVHDRKDGYFAHHGRTLKPTDIPMDEEQARLAAMRRRSSVPEIISPLPEGAERGSHWDPATKHAREKDRKSRSHSAQRPPYPTRQRSTTNPTTHSPNHPHSHSPSDRRHGSNSDHQNTHSRPPSSYSHSYHQRSSGRRPKSPSTVDEGSGSEASSENSHNGRRSQQRKSDEERQGRRSSLWPPSFLKSHKRRHSSDASPRKIEAKPSLPLRPEFYPPKHVKTAPLPSQPVLHSPHRPTPNPGVRFRNDIFVNDKIPSAPDSPVHRSRMNGQPPPVIRYPDTHPPYPTQQMEGMAVGQPLSRYDSSSSGNDRRYNSDWDRNAQRKAGAPLRVSTVSGVGGRKYPDAAMSAGEKERQHARVRGSLPTMA